MGQRERDLRVSEKRRWRTLRQKTNAFAKKFEKDVAIVILNKDTDEVVGYTTTDNVDWLHNWIMEVGCC